MIAQRTIAIVGLGLIGGSLARDLAAGGARVLGYDRDEESVTRAMDSGSVHTALDASLAGIAEADWLILAVPVSERVELLRRIAAAGRHLTLITDVGSTQRSAVEAARRLGLTQFVGSHPLTGCHRSSWSASRAGLFAGAQVFLCVDASARADSVAHARKLWESLGGVPTVSSAEDHDEHVAWVSHLPHVASFALAHALEARGKAYAELGPGGRDAMRLASSSPSMWRAVMLENAGAICGAIGALESELKEFRSALERGDAEALEGRMASAAAWCAAKAG